MFSFEYDFFPDYARTDVESFVDTHLHALHAALYRDGYVLDRLCHVLQLEDRLRLFCIAPTKDALDAARSNRDVQRCMDRMIEQSSLPPSIRIAGKVVGMPDCCSCEDPAWYLLFTTFLEDGPPVRCGDCDHAVPLYRLPTLDGEEEHHAIRGWAAAYQSYDTLFMLSGSGERLGYRQMAEVESDLTREGREICAAMSDRTGKPWYYFLHRYDEPQAEVCPGCGDPWELDEPLHERYDFKCDRCCLVSLDPGS